MHFWKLFLFALISSLITPATHAQDPAAVNPTIAYHTLSHDTVFVHLSDSVTLSQVKDKDWGPSRPSKPGEVSFDNDSQHPFTHHVKNTGTTPYRVLDIELHP